MPITYLLGIVMEYSLACHNLLIYSDLVNTIYVHQLSAL